MANVQIEFSNRDVRVLKEIKNELLWYDAKCKKMHHFQGTHLVFTYRKEQPKERIHPRADAEQRWLPSVIVAKGISYERMGNREKFMRWFNSYVEESGSLAFIEPNTLSATGVAINVPDGEADAFVDEAEYVGFKCYAEETLKEETDADGRDS